MVYVTCFYQIKHSFLLAFAAKVLDITDIHVSSSSPIFFFFNVFRLGLLTFRSTGTTVIVEEPHDLCLLILMPFPFSVGGNCDWILTTIIWQR